MVKKSACEQNDALLRQMLANHETLQSIAKAVGTSHHRVHEYIERHNIPHLPFRSNSHSGQRNGRWKGGRIIDKDGYALVKAPSHPHCNRHGYVREHRLMMERKLGRYLLPTEVVHHVDGDKLNNAIENLQLFERNAEHLAETLRGQVPHWTPDGIRRIQEGSRKPRPHRHNASRKA